MKQTGKKDMTEKIAKSSQQISEKKQSIKYDTRDYVIGYLKKYMKRGICMFHLSTNVSLFGDQTTNVFL